MASLFLRSLSNTAGKTFEVWPAVQAPDIPAGGSSERPCHVWRAIVARLASRGRMVRTTSLRGFLLLYCLASMKTGRRRTLRFHREMGFIAEWIETVLCAARVDLPLAVVVAEQRNLVKGYGDTYQRGLEKYSKIRAFLLKDIENPGVLLWLRALMAAAQRDESGAALDLQLQKLSSTA